MALLGQACTLISADKRSVYQYKDHAVVADGALRRSLDGFGNAMWEEPRCDPEQRRRDLSAMTVAVRDAWRTIDLESDIFKNDKAKGSPPRC